MVQSTQSRLNELRRAYRDAKFIIAHRASRIIISDTPHLDHDALEYFENLLQRTSCYLEYGSGGSTVLAHKYVDCLVSVESDSRFLKAVQAKLESNPSGAETVLIGVNVGLTKQWGRPVFTNATARRTERWQAYPKAPWRFFADRQAEPDVILIDGRYRVACTLESLLKLKDCSTTLLLLDDYSDRPHYSVVEECAELVDMKGRMAVFAKKQELDPEHCEVLLKKHYADFR